MKVMRIPGWPILALFPLLLTGCPSPERNGGGKGTGSEVVTADGSSTVYPVMESAAEEFSKATGKRVTVAQSGTGGGFKKFTRGETDVSNASRPILQREIEEARKNGVEYIELPLCFDALTVVVNKENDWVDHLTTEELRKIWDRDSRDTVTRWSDVRAGWPEEKLLLFGPGTDSGTFDYFTEAINGRSGLSRDDYTASEDDNLLVNGVAGNRGALGYFGYAYYAAHRGKLRAVPIQSAKGKVKTPVAPGPDAILQGTYFPLSRPLFLYVNKKAVESRPEVREFVTFVLENAEDLATNKKYVPLPKEAYAICRERLKNLEAGSAFGGEAEVGVPITELLKRKLK